MTETQASIVYSMALSHNIDANLVRAIVEVESAGNPLACRFEPGWEYFVTILPSAERLGSTAQTERAQQATSWGPMQIMGSNARALGYQGWLAGLASWSVGLDYGCQHLKSCLKRWPDEKDAIAAYNGGSPRRKDDGSYWNEFYVNRVTDILTKLRGTPSPTS